MGTDKKLFFIIRLLVAISILYFIYSNFPLSDVIKVLSGANIGIVALSATLPFISYMTASYRLWQLVLNQGVKMTFFKIFEINLATIFYGLFLPGGNMAGGAVRVYKISGQDRRVAETLASITFDRVLATLALIIVGILFWIINKPSNSSFLVSVMISGVVVIVILQIAVWSRYISALNNSIYINKKSFIPSKIKRLLRTVSNYRELSVHRYLILLAISIGSQFIGILSYYLLAKSIGIDVSFAAMGWVRSAVILVTMIPVSISGFGLREGALLYLLHSYGVAADKTLAFSLLVYFITIFTIGVIGGLIEGVRVFIFKDNE